MRQQVEGIDQVHLVADGDVDTMSGSRVGVVRS